MCLKSAMSREQRETDPPKITAVLCRLTHSALKPIDVWVPLSIPSNYQGHAASYGAHSHSQLPDHSCNLRHLEHTHTHTGAHLAFILMPDLGVYSRCQHLSRCSAHAAVLNCVPRWRTSSFRVSFWETAKGPYPAANWRIKFTSPGQSATVVLSFMPSSRFFFHHSHTVNGLTDKLKAYSHWKHNANKYHKSAILEDSSSSLMCMLTVWTGSWVYKHCHYKHSFGSKITVSHKLSWVIGYFILISVIEIV